MPLLIDGYNLLHASNILGRGRGPGYLERARKALLNFLVDVIDEQERPRTTIVFDARNAPWGVSDRQLYQGIRVLFARTEDDADSLIEELIKQDSAPKSLTVVSSDHRLHRAANRRKATAIDSDRWIASMLRNRQQRGQVTPQSELPKPDGPFASGEVDFWLKTFGFDAEDDAAGA